MYTLCETSSLSVRCPRTRTHCWLGGAIHAAAAQEIDHRHQHLVHERVAFVLRSGIMEHPQERKQRKKAATATAATATTTTATTQRERERGRDRDRAGERERGARERERERERNKDIEVLVPWLGLMMNPTRPQLSCSREAVRLFQ